MLPNPRKVVAPANEGGLGKPLMKIGRLAEAAGETVPTIRHWTSHGLLAVAQASAAGYQLYAPDAVDRCRRIQCFKARRLTLAEIRAVMLEENGDERGD